MKFYFASVICIFSSDIQCGSLSVNELHRGCRGYQAVMCSVRYELSPKKQVLTSFSVRYDLRPKNQWNIDCVVCDVRAEPLDTTHLKCSLCRIS